MVKTLSAIAISLISSIASADCYDDYIDLKEKPNKLDGRTFEATMWVPAPMTDLYQVITDAEEHPEFVPDLAKVVVEQLEDGSSHQQQYLDLPMGKKKRYKLAVEATMADSVARVSWKMIDWPQVPKDERIADTQGYWQLTKESENCTKALYHVYTDPGKVPFGLGWIVDSMTEDSVPALMEAMRERVLAESEE